MQWFHALADVHREPASYEPGTYEEYSTRTRVHCVRVMDNPPCHKAAMTDTYPTQQDSAFHRTNDLRWELYELASSLRSLIIKEHYSMARQEIRQTDDQILEASRRVIQLMSCRRPRDVANPPMHGQGVSHGASRRTAPHLNMASGSS